MYQKDVNDDYGRDYNKDKLMAMICKMNKMLMIMMMIMVIFMMMMMLMINVSQ